MFTWHVQIYRRLDLCWSVSRLCCYYIRIGLVPIRIVSHYTDDTYNIFLFTYLFLLRAYWCSSIAFDGVIWSFCWMFERSFVCSQPVTNGLFQELLNGSKSGGQIYEQINSFDPHFLTSTTWFRYNYKLLISNWVGIYPISRPITCLPVHGIWIFVKVCPPYPPDPMVARPLVNLFPGSELLKPCNCATQRL